MKRKVIAAPIAISLFAVFPMAVSSGEASSNPDADIYVNTTGWWRPGAAFNESSNPIQDAINNASDGNTIFVYNGTYLLTGGVGDWRLFLDTPNITLKGEGADKVILDGMGKAAIALSAWGTAPGCIIEGFTITNSSVGIGILEDDSPNCIIRDNIFYNLSSPIGNFAPNTTITDNLIEGGPALRFDHEGYSVTFINNIVTNTTKTYYAVRFKGPNSIVVNNTLINNAGGLGLYGANAVNITVARNNLISNGAGIKLYKTGSGNKIYLNNIINNTASVVISQTTATQYWNSTKPINYTYNGRTYTNYLGNYWSDYTGTDEDGDGIGDTPYPIPGSATDKDYRPLMAGFENYPAPTPPTPFYIYGWVNYSNGEPVNNPNVRITNLNTSEEFIAETSATSNYYQVSTTSCNVSAGNMLHFNASDNIGNFTEFNHTVTQEEMNNGGFVQNITITLPAIPMPDLIVTAINAYHNNTGCPAWFNLSNEVDVTVKNIGTASAGAFNISLYIEGDYGDTTMHYFGKLPVPGLGAGNSTTVTFTDWVPIGDDCLKPPCDFNWSYKDYNFTAIADCDNDVAESNETNNETTIVDRACYNGYMADEPLENVAHGTLKGHLIYTTGDGVYSSLYNVGDTQTTHYNITLPAGATVELAHLNVYYTWNKPEGTCPEMEVNITTPGGTTYTLPLMKAYNDIKCTCPGALWVYPWGNYVYNVTDYITGSGTYTVTVKNVCTACQSFCVAAPGIVLVYEDANAPLIEYWVNEGADVLLGGRRYPTTSNLAWWECMNNATFPASTETKEVVNATLGVVAPWGDNVPNDILFFNDIELGRGVYNNGPYTKTIDSITMEIGASGAQVGVNVTNVTALYLNNSENVVTQADDGDNMMPANAFLVVEFVPMVIPVDIDIKPGSYPNAINPNSKGVIPVAILTTETFDASSADPTTVRFGGTGTEASPVHWAMEDVDDDGDIDMILHFNTQDTGIQKGDTEAKLTGKTVEGIPIEGSDSIKTVPR